MMQCCDEAKSNAGFSVLEALLTIAVLALTIAMLSGRTPEPSTELLLANQIGELQKDAATRRAQAIITRQPIRFEVEQETCDDVSVPVVFFPDGTVSGGEICLSIENTHRTLIIHQLTGQIQEASEP